jgi:hypothetical protein
MSEERAALGRLSRFYKTLAKEVKDTERERYLKLAGEAERKAASLPAFADPE